MTVSLYTLLETCLLCINGIAILHEERFLAPMGWGRHQERGFDDDKQMKTQIINLIHSVRTVMRVPLIFLNVFTIVFKLLLG